MKAVMNEIKILILTSISMVVVDSSVIMNGYDDTEECNLNANLVKEIASYKKTTKYIMEEIKTKYGPAMYQEYTKFIDKFGARPCGTDVLERSIDYMVNLTVQNGLDVATEELDVPHWVRVHESAAMIQPQAKKIAILGVGTSISTPPKGITAEAIVIDSFEALEEIDKKDIQGKIVVFDANYTNYGDTVVFRKHGAAKAAKKGAIAALIRSITPFSLYTPHTGFQAYDENIPKIPAATITLEDADLMRRLQEKGEKIILHIKLISTFDTTKSRNTIIDLKGNENPDKIVIVSGHIDSWDVGQGAIDDGGGMMISWFTPVILNILKLKPKRTIRAILWTAEEPGLIGSEVYLKKHMDELQDINFIMESDEGTFKPLGLDVAGCKQARCIVQEVLKLFAPINQMKHSEQPGSDMFLFVEEGVPGASLLNEDERYFWYHHSESDTMNVQNMDDVVDCAAFYAAFAYVIADLSGDIPRE